MKLLEDKIHIGNSMRKNIEFLYDPKEKRFYSKHKHGGVDEIELEELSIKALLNSLKKDRDRLEWTPKGKKLFPKNAPKSGDIGQHKTLKGETIMKKADVKRIIKEELAKALYKKIQESKDLLTEKFASKKLARLAKEKDFKKSKFFQAAANTYSIAWDQVPDSAVTLNKPSGNSDVVNFFFVDKSMRNPFQGSSWDGTIYPGLIGATKGKKLIHIERARWGDKGEKIGGGKPGSRMGSRTAGLHNFKRYAEVADRVYSIDISKLKGGTDTKKSDRAAAKAGATAIMDAKKIAADNRARYEKMLTDRLAKSSPGDQIIKMVDAVTKMYKESVDKQLAMLKKKKVSSGWNDSATLIMRAYRNIIQEFEYYLRAENNVIKGAERDKAEKLKRGDDAAWSEEKYYKKEMIKKARKIQSEFKTLKAALKKQDASKDYIDLR